MSVKFELKYGTGAKIYIEENVFENVVCKVSNLFQSWFIEAEGLKYIGKLTIIGSNNGLSPGRRQAIIWTNAAILLIGHFGTISVKF